MSRVLSLRSVLEVTLCLLVVSLLCAPSAFGHAALLSSTPAPGQRVEVPPSQITLNFSEPLIGRLTGATLRDSTAGREIAASAATNNRHEVVITPASPLPRGAYRVSWRTVSTDDGHALEGSFSFGVQAAAVGKATVESDPLARLGWLRAVVRAAMYIALLLFCGGVFLAALRPRWLVPDSLLTSDITESDLKSASGKQRSLIADAGLFAAGLAVAAALVEAATAADSLAPSQLSAFFLSSLAGVARIAVVIFVLLALWLVRRNPRIAAVAAICALGGVVASGHANSATPRGLAIVVDWIHLGAGAVWFAGVCLLLLVWGAAMAKGGRPLRTAIAREVLPGLGAIALPAFILLVGAGAVRAVLELGSLSQLWTTSYGIVLIVKIALVCAIAVLAWRHAGRLGPRLAGPNSEAVSASNEATHWRFMRYEAVLAVGVLLMAALLSVFPLPPRQADRATAAQGSASACDPACPLPIATSDQLNVAAQGGSQVVAGWIRRTSSGLQATVRIIDSKGAAAKNPIEVPAATKLTNCGVGCYRLSTLTLSETLRVRVSQDGRWYDAVLPARWEPLSQGPARSLLARAQSTMRAVDSIQEAESVSSGPGQNARVDYRLLAPDRLAWRTDLGIASITVGDRQFIRGPDQPWSETPTPGGVPFRTRSWFRWTPYARTVAILSRHLVAGRERVELALADPATPVWALLSVDSSSGRVITESLVAPARFIVHRYSDFNKPLNISIPQTTTP
ncbi:MAG: copper resistance protein CopC [Solirubrobacterales bacterium]|nr:copper resistance protein CopC [Solirubrobacterales bacterium]